LAWMIVLVGCQRPAAEHPDPASEPTPAPATGAEPGPATQPSTMPEQSAADSEAAPATPASSEDGNAPSPAPESNSSAPKETRTQEVIRGVVMQHRQDVRDCYEIERSAEPTLRGTLTIDFKLDPKGKVVWARLNDARSTLKMPTLVDCAIAAIQDMPFPPSSRRFESLVTYPFDFRP